MQYGGGVGAAPHTGPGRRGGRRPASTAPAHRGQTSPPGTRRRAGVLPALHSPMSVQTRCRGTATVCTACQGLDALPLPQTPSDTAPARTPQPASPSHCRVQAMRIARSWFLAIQQTRSGRGRSWGGERHWGVGEVGMWGTQEDERGSFQAETEERGFPD